MTHVALFLLGPPRLEVDGAPVKLGRHKATALLAYLALNPETHSRNRLATLLWPNHNQSRARAALRRALATLNEAGLGPWLAVARETVQIRAGPVKAGPALWLDVAQFRQLSAGCEEQAQAVDRSCEQQFARATALYRADFMAGFRLPDSPDFDEWRRLQAAHLRYELANILERLTRYYRSRQEFEPAMTYARRWLELDPLQEAAHRELMRLYAESGQRTAAIRQYQECVHLLDQALQVLPGRETAALYEQIQQGLEKEAGQADTKTLRDGSPAAPPAAGAVAPFPVQPTSFIGRQKELAEIAARLDRADCRLLTLIGPGGIGKTRLAIQAAGEQTGKFADGSCFVPLAPVSSPDFLIGTIADSLSLSLDGQDEMQLLNFLRTKQMLLVLDNFEHLTRRAGLLANILAYAPGVKMLVSSRERLNLQGEWVFEVKGLSYPNDPQTQDVEGYSAVALFLGRAAQVQPGFSLPEAEKPFVVRICQLLEGIPLGIELAASWVRALSCREISQEIERIYRRQADLDFLASPLRDIPERHQNLRGVFQHSWQLLSSDEQEIFRKLAVFRGGAGREAISFVTQAPLPLILTLIDKSLLHYTDAGRYEMHEMLRQYGAEKLEARPEEAELIYQRHGHYYATFLQQREQRLKGAEQKETLAEIAREIENIRECWRWAISRENIGEIERAAESLWYFYSMYSWFEEGTEAFGRALAVVQNAKKDDRHLSLVGRMLVYLGWFYLRQGLYEQARELLQQSIALFRQLGDQSYIAAPLHHLGLLAGEVGEAGEAVRFLEESLAIYRTADNPWGVAWALSSLAYYLYELEPGRSAEAKEQLQESLAIYNRIGNQQGIAIALNNLGCISSREGDYGTARRLLEESLALRRAVGFPRGIVVALNNLGHVRGALGEDEQCKACYFEALRIAGDIQIAPLTLAALGGLALPLMRAGEIDRAVVLLKLVLAHPASNRETRERAATSLQELMPAQGDDARPLMRFRNLAEVVEEVLNSATKAVNSLPVLPE